MSAREEILARVRAALADVDTYDEPVKAPLGRPFAGDLVERFVERVRDYRAVVETCTEAELVAAVRRALGASERVLVPPGLGLDLPDAVVDDGPHRADVPLTNRLVGEGFSAAELDTYDAVVTAARLGIAETGTIVLDHTPDQGRRAISLVPDLHVCVVRRDQVVADVPDAIAVLDPARPLTWISGPSATSDIELDRVEGVHGPRTLHVLVVG